MSCDPGHQDSENLNERVRAQEQRLRDLQLAQARFLEKYGVKMAQAIPPKSPTDSEPSD